MYKHTMMHANRNIPSCTSHMTAGRKSQMNSGSSPMDSEGERRRLSITHWFERDEVIRRVHIGSCMVQAKHVPSEQVHTSKKVICRTEPSTNVQANNISFKLFVASTLSRRAESKMQALRRYFYDEVAKAFTQVSILGANDTKFYKYLVELPSPFDLQSP